MDNQLEEAIDKGVEFLVFEQDAEGLWLDFRSNTNREGRDWVSAVIGSELLKADLDPSFLERTAQSIAEGQYPGGGFGYSSKSPIGFDLDSTACAVMFLSEFSEYFEQVKRGRELLKAFQYSDGSFATYPETAIRRYHRITPEMDVSGWALGTPEVTGNAVRALEFDEKGINYLLANQQEDGSWLPYWWTDAIFSTVLSLESIRHTQGADKAVRRAEDYLVDRARNVDMPFYVAAIARGLAPAGETYRDTLDAVAQKLLTTQYDNGTWQNGALIRVPHPSNREPWNTTVKWRDDLVDQNSYFTTGHCIGALGLYKKVTEGKPLPPSLSPIGPKVQI